MHATFFSIYIERKVTLLRNFQLRRRLFIMRISPISLRSLQATSRAEPGATSKSSKSKKKIRSEVDRNNEISNFGNEISGIILFDDPKFLEEDPSSSEDLWNKEHDKIEFSQEAVFKNELKLSLQAHQSLLDVMTTTSKSISLTPIMSLQHLTLPEALLFFNIIHDDFPKEDCILKWNYEAKGSDKRILNFPFYLKRNKNFVSYRKILHHVGHLKSKIVEKGTQVGSIKYVLRNKKLEEIEGIYKNNKILLDPIWVHSNKIVNEKVKLGTASTDLIPDQQQKRGFVHKNDPLQISVSKIATSKIDTNIFVTFKKVKIGNYCLNTKLIFSKYCLMPISGVIEILYTSSKKGNYPSFF